MQKEGLKGECPHGFTQLSVRSQDMAVLLHRMKQLNELDHTEFSAKYWYNPWAWKETAEQTDARYEKHRRDMDYYNSEAQQKKRAELHRQITGE